MYSGEDFGNSVSACKSNLAVQTALGQFHCRFGFAKHNPTFGCPHHRQQCKIYTLFTVFTLFQDFYDDYAHTGDPQLDLEYERNYYANRMPENVKYFLMNFCQAIKEGNLYDIQNMYENTFPQISDHHFDKTAWPEEQEVGAIVDNDKVFLILYKELYYRHIHARIPGGPKLEQRINSFFNYCDFFNLIISAQNPVMLELPDIWLWELVDEFVYQFQNFAQYRYVLSAWTIFKNGS